MSYIVFGDKKLLIFGKDKLRFGLHRSVRLVDKAFEIYLFELSQNLLDLRLSFRMAGGEYGANMLSRLVISFLLRSKRLLISWL